MPIYLPSISPQEPQQQRAQSASQPIPITDPGAAVRKPSEQEQQISGLAGDLQRVRLQESRVNVQTQLNGAHDDFTEQFEGPNGYLHTVGSEATPERAASAFKEVDNRAKARRDSLRNDYERKLFDLGYVDRRQSFSSAAARHYADQVQVREAGVGQADLTNKIDDTVRSYGSDTFLEKSRAAVVAAMRLSTTMGWTGDDPRRRELIDKTTSAIHSSVTKQLLGVTDGTAAQQAKDYLDNVPPSQIDPDTRLQLYDLIERQDLHDTARRIAASGLSPAAAREEAIEDTGLQVSKKLLAPPYEEPKQQEPGEQPKSFVQTFRDREHEWEMRVQQAFAAADNIESSKLKKAVIGNLKDAVQQHDALMARSHNTAQDAAEKWVRDQPPAEVVEWTQAPADLQQAAEAYGFTDHMVQFARTRVKVSSPAALTEVETMSTDDLVQAGLHLDEWIRDHRKWLKPEDMASALGRIDKAMGFKLGYDQTQSEIDALAKTAAMRAGVNIFSTNDSVQADVRWYVDTFRDMVRQQEGKPAKERIPVEKLQQDLIQNHAAYKAVSSAATPEEAGKVMFTADDGRQVSLQHLQLDPRVAAAVKASHGDPGNLHDLVNGWETVSAQDRAARVRDTAGWLRERQVPEMPGHPGYVSAEAAAQLFGVSPTTLENEINSLRLSGQDPPVIYGRSADVFPWGLPAPFTLHGVPRGFSTLAISNLRRIPVK